MSRSGYFRLILFCSVIFNNGLRAQTLHMCADQLESSMCDIVCITPDLTKTVAFYKFPDTGTEIAQCIPSVTCIAKSPYTITQPNSTSTMLTFELTRNITGQYRCNYGSTFTDGTLNWGTYPENVVVTDLANGSEITSTTDFTMKLECLRSAEDPTVILLYEDNQGNIDATSDQFSCSNLQTSSCYHDDELTSYHCPCKLKHRAGIECKDIYDVDSYITITHIGTQWNISIVEDITFPCTSTTTQSITTQKPKPTSCGKVGCKTFAGIVAGAVSFVAILIIILCYCKRTRGKH